MCSSDHSDTTAHSSTPASVYSDTTSAGTSRRLEVITESSKAQLTSESSTMWRVEEDDSSIGQPKMTTVTESMTHSSKIIDLITESSTRPMVTDEEDEESWEDFDWESSREVIEIESSTTMKSVNELSSRSNTVTLPPSLLEDVGGDWGDDFDDMWEEGWK